MERIDLHVHSNQSDGTHSPADLTAHAAKCGLTAFALTDHDTISGIAQAIEAGHRFGIEVIPGIEFSTDYHGKNIHIVGLDFDWENPDFERQTESIRTARSRRNQQMIDRMAADGIDISHEKMVEAFGETTWTRANFARYLADHGYVPEIWSAFKTHIGEHCKYYVPRAKVHPGEVTRLIRHFGGIPVLAHPYEYSLTETELTALLKELKEDGLIGVECWYSNHSEAETARILSLCKDLQLLPSGGSDFHGNNKPEIGLGTGHGNLAIPYEVISRLRSAAGL